MTGRHGHRQPLAALEPRYIALPERSAMGVSFQCPREDASHLAAHGPHRVELWFLHPDDHGDPNYDAAPYVYRHMGTLEDLAHFTLYDLGGNLEAPGHWRGYIAEGVLYWWG